MRDTAHMSEEGADHERDVVVEGSKTKRKRQSQSCDACRVRKVKCARDDPSRPCKHCVTLGVPCTYEYQPKKRGPPNLYLRRLHAAAAAAASAQQSGRESNFTSQSILQNFSPTQSNLPTSSLHSSILDSSLRQSPTVNSHARSPLSPEFSHPIPWISSPTAANYGPLPSSSDIPLERTHRSCKSDGSIQFQPVAGSSSSDWTYKQQLVPSNPLPGFHSLLGSFRPHRLESVAPRETFSLIIDLYFDYLYPLMPCVHRPSFMVNFHSRREEQDPLFFALVMSITASTLVQMPRSYLPTDPQTARRLAQTCYEASRLASVALCDPPSSTQVVIRYFDFVYHYCDGTTEAAQHTAYGEAAHLAISLGLHEETSYEGLDPVECEIRRRTFWLLFGADKSMAILQGRPVWLREEDCTVQLPKELDDEYITLSGYLPQPHGKTATVCGLNHATRILVILGVVLTRMRLDKRSPPQGPFITARFEEIRCLHSRLLSVGVDVPEPLRLQQHRSPLASDYGAAGFQQANYIEVKDFFDNADSPRKYASNPFLVMQANIHVTQQLVRFAIEKYWEELLLSSVHLNIHEHQGVLNKEATVTRLLNILNGIPIPAIAANGPSLVRKVRYIASTLLDTVQRGGLPPSSNSRTHSLLWSLLSTLSEIEKNYLLDDDRDSSGDSMHPL